MQRDRNLIHHQIKRHPLRRLHTHKHRSEQQRTHPLRSSQLQPRHLDVRPPLRLGKLPPIHRRQTQNATNIALTNTPLPHECIPGTRKISRPVTQNPTTNLIIRRPSPHLTQTHRILSTPKALTPRQRRPRPPRMTTTRHPQSSASLHNTTPRSPPSLIFNPEPLCMQPVQSFLSRRGPSLGLSPHNPHTQLPPRDPTPPNPLPLPFRSTPCLPPSIFPNPATLCMHPVQSVLWRHGPSLVLSPHNPPTQLPPRDPTPPSALPLPVRSTPRSPPSRIASPATLCMQPVQSFFSRRGSSLGLSPHNPPTQLLQRDPTPPSFFLSCIRILLPGRDRTIPARRRVSRRLDRRRPSLRLTRIHLPRPPLRGSTAHQPALPNTPHSRRHTPNTTHRWPGSTPHIRRPLQTRLPHPRRQLFGTRLRGRTGLPLGQTIPRGPMQRDRNVIHDQIKRHPLRRLHTHKHRSEQQRTHTLRSSQLQPRHLNLRPPLNLSKPPPIHRRQTQNATNIALTNTPLPHEYIPGTRKISRPVTHNPTTTPRGDRRDGFGCHPPAIRQHRHPVGRHVHTDDLGARQIRCRLRSLLDRLDGITGPPEQCRSWRTSHLGGRLDRPRPASVHPVQHPLRTPAPVHPRQHIRTGTAAQLSDLGIGDDHIVMPEHQQRLSAVRERGGMIRRAGPRGVLGSVGGALDRKNHRHTTHTPTEIRS